MLTCGCTAHRGSRLGWVVHALSEALELSWPAPKGDLLRDLRIHVELRDLDSPEHLLLVLRSWSS